MVSELTASELSGLIDSDADFELVDTRPEESYSEWHVRGAKNFAFEQGDDFDADAFADAVGVDRDDSIVTVCAKGISSYEFADRLVESGFEDVAVVEGGMEAWSRLHESVRVPIDGFEAVQVQRRSKGCLGYVVAYDGVGAVFDPTRHTNEFVEAADELGIEIRHVFDTHVHADHISGGRRLADETGADYYLSERARQRGVEYGYTALGRNETVDVGGLDVKAVETPGHTSESVSYVLGTEAVVTGDTLFVDSVGRTELEFGGGDEEASHGARLLYDSLQSTLLAQPDSLTVLPGHFSVTDDGRTPGVTPGEPVFTTVGEARRRPVFDEDRDEFVAQVVGSLPEEPPNYETMVEINTGRRSVENEERATELELGPNRCAATESG